MAVNHPLHPAFTPSFPTAAASRRAGEEQGPTRAKERVGPLRLSPGCFREQGHMWSLESH